MAQPAPWCQKDFATSADRFYGLTHKRDSVLGISKQHSIWKRMGMLADADTTSADSITFGASRALVTNFEPNVKAKIQPLYRNLPAQEYALPEGEARKQLKTAWLYILGNSER